MRICRPIKHVAPLIVMSALCYVSTKDFWTTYNRQDRIVSDAENVIPSHPKILVADCFEYADVCINNDKIPDVPHGEIVSKIIEQNLPNADVRKSSIVPLPSETVSKGCRSNLSHNLDTLLTGIIERNEKYDVINLSLGFELPFEYLSEVFGFNITPENIKEQKSRLRNALAKSDIVIKTHSLKTLASILDKMDLITARGSKFYVASGNEGKEALNLLSLANDIESVGSCRKDGGKMPYTEHHNLVTRYEYDQFPINKTENGFDITGDGRTDFTFEQMSSSKENEPRKNNLQGTSYATPNAIIKDLEAK